MGSKLSKFYDEAQQLGGASAQMKLAMLTLMSARKAAEAEDSPENLKKFSDAMVQIKQEFAKK
jgi:hypothetical protein